MRNKKAEYNFQDIAWIGIVICFGIITLSILATVVGNVRTAHTRDSNTIVNETDAVNLIWKNATNMSTDFQEISILNITACNDTTFIVRSANYTLYSDVGKIQCDTNFTTILDDGDLACVSYTYLDKDAPFNITVKGETGQLKFANWLPTIGLVIGAVIVMGVLMYFGVFRKG